MTTFNIGDTFTISCAADTQVSFNGIARIKVSPVSGSPWEFDTTGSQTLGPFHGGATLSVTATTGGSYTATVNTAYDSAVLATTDPVTGRISFSAHETGGSGSASFRAATLIRGAMQTGALGSNANYHTTLTVPDRFDAVRIGVFNIAASSYAIKAIVAPSAFAGAYQTVPYRTSTGETQDNSIDTATSLWKSVTWGGAATATLNTTATAAQPALTWSDWITCSSLDRLDTPGALPLVMARIYTPSTGYVDVGGTQDSITADQTYLQSVNPGFIWRTDNLGGGDAVGTPSNWNASVASVQGGGGLIPIIQVRHRNPVVSVLTVGDSTYHGIGGTNNLGWVPQAFCNPSLRVTHSNIGWSGQTSAQYYARFSAQLLTDLQPSVVIYQLASPNDSSSWTAATSSAQRARALSVIDTCRAAGVKVIISTPMPYSASAVAGSAQTEVTALTSFALGFDSYSGVVGMDLSALHVSGSPGQWNATYGPVTTYHPNETGTQSIIVPAAVLALKKLYSV